jgi:hypothetical protein
MKRGILWLSVEERVLEGGRIRQNPQLWAEMVGCLAYTLHAVLYIRCARYIHINTAPFWVFTVHANKRAIVPASCLPRAPDLIAARRPRRWPHPRRRATSDEVAPCRVTRSSLNSAPRHSGVVWYGLPHQQ